MMVDKSLRGMFHLPGDMTSIPVSAVGERVTPLDKKPEPKLIANETTTDRPDVAELKNDIAWAEKAEAEALDEYDEAKTLTRTLREHLAYLEGVICKQPGEGEKDQPG